MRTIHSIVIHHSASAITTTPNEIRSWHISRGFSGIGYHYVIYNNGTKWVGSQARDEKYTGAHCKGFNTGTLGICVCGNYENIQVQESAYKLLVAQLVNWCKKYKIKPDNIFGYRDKGDTPTACPGKNLYEMLPQLREQIRKEFQ
jgi:N-acetylmuramoyl-L-alanine amidase